METIVINLAISDTLAESSTDEELRHWLGDMALQSLREMLPKGKE